MSDQQQSDDPEVSDETNAEDESQPSDTDKMTLMQEQMEEALDARADHILLDNMSNTEMVEAITLKDEINPGTFLEASGGITLQRIPEIANIGLDFISVGAITHSAKAIDIGLDFSEIENYPGTSE